MISVRTPSGKVLHLASSRTAMHTFCGRIFYDNIDEIRDLASDATPASACRSCAEQNARKRRRKLLHGL